MKKEINICVVLILLTIQVKSQANWKLGGNPNFGIDGLVSVSNVFGSTQNTSLVFQTFGLNRMILDNGNASQTGGRLSLGNNLPSNFAPQSRIHIHQTGIANNNIDVRFNLKMYLS